MKPTIPTQTPTVAKDKLGTTTNTNKGNAATTNAGHANKTGVAGTTTGSTNKWNTNISNAGKGKDLHQGQIKNPKDKQ